jgi:hypothetical protein
VSASAAAIDGAPNARAMIEAVTTFKNFVISMLTVVSDANLFIPYLSILIDKTSLPFVL